MKAVILCGGRGTRLHEETDVKPKPLVMIGERPILWHIMKLYSHYGYNDFILCIGYKGEMIKNYFLNYDEMANDFTIKLGSAEKNLVHHNSTRPDWKITFVDTGGPDVGTGTRIARIKSHIGDDKEFMLTYGDGVSNINLSELYKYHKEKGKLATVTGIQRTDHYGIIDIDDNGVAVRFAEKPKVRDITNGGFFVCKKDIFKYLPDEDGGSYMFEDSPLINITKDAQLAVYHHKGFWQCVDTYKQLLDLNSMHSTGNRPWMVWESA